MRAAPPRVRELAATESSAWVGELRQAWVNAFAVDFSLAVGSRAQAILVTTGLMERLSDEELRAIVRHEAAHLAESSRTRMLRGLAATLTPALFVLAPLLDGALPGFAPFLRDSAVELTVLLGGIIASSVIRGSLSRFETLADSSAAGPSMETYARALEKIHEAALAPITLRAGTQTHPAPYDRLVSIGCPPSYARPPAAVSDRALTLAGTGLCLTMVFILTLAARRDGDVSLAMFDPTEATAAQVAAVYLARGDLASASSAVEACPNPTPPLHRCALLKVEIDAALDRCAKARSRLEGVAKVVRHQSSNLEVARRAVDACEARARE
ncbi:MAG: M48 family metalloprotease [Polyangiaceae bacterium]